MLFIKLPHEFIAGNDKDKKLVIIYILTKKYPICHTQRYVFGLLMRIKNMHELHIVNRSQDYIIIQLPLIACGLNPI